MRKLQTEWYISMKVMNCRNKILNISNGLKPHIRASICFVICNVFQKVINFVCTPVYTRLLTAEQFGVFVLFQSWTGVIAVFLTLNLFFSSYIAGLTHYQYDEEAFTASNIGLVFALVSCGGIILFLCKSTFVRITTLPVQYILLIVVEVFFSAIFSFWIARERFFYRLHEFFVVTFVKTTLTSVVGIVLMCSTPNECRLDIKIVTEILGTVLVGGYCLCRMHKPGMRYFDNYYWGMMLKRNIPLIPHYLSGTALNQSDRIMIDRMLGTNFTAYYSIAYSVAMMMLVVTGAIKNAIDPIVYKEIKDGKTEKLKRMMSQCFGLVACTCCFVAIFAPEIMRLLSPVEYWDAKYVIPVLSVSVFFIFSYNIFSIVEFYFGKSLLITMVSIIGALLNIVLNWLLIPIKGYMVAGYTTLVCYVVFSGCHLIAAIHLSKKNNINFFVDVRKYLVIAMILVANGLIIPFTFDSILKRFFGVAVYALVLVKIISRIHLCRRVGQILGGVKSE